MKLTVGKRIAIELLIMAILIVALTEFVEWALPLVTRPDEQTRLAYGAVAESVRRCQPFETVSPEQRALFLEHSGWSPEDVALVDQVLQATQAEIQKLAPPGGGGYSIPASLMQPWMAADRLNEWDADEALEILRAVQLE